MGPQGHVTGIDVSPGMLAQARQKAQQAGLTTVSFQRGDAQQLPCADGTFDRVCCASALVLTRDVSAAPREWDWVLKPGGLLAFDAPDYRDFGLMGPMADAARRHGVVLSFFMVAATPERCRALLKGAGLEMLGIQDVTDKGETPPP